MIEVRTLFLLDSFLEGGNGFFLSDFDFERLLIIIAVNIAEKFEHHIRTVEDAVCLANQYTESGCPG